jgi:hypothetical protein
MNNWINKLSNKFPFFKYLNEEKNILKRRIELLETKSNFFENAIIEKKKLKLINFKENSEYKCHGNNDPMLAYIAKEYENGEVYVKWRNGMSAKCPITALNIIKV